MPQHQQLWWLFGWDRELLQYSVPVGTSTSESTFIPVICSDFMAAPAGCGVSAGCGLQQHPPFTPRAFYRRLCPRHRSPGGSAPCIRFKGEFYSNTTTTALRGRPSYWDAQSRHFEGLRLFFLASSDGARGGATPPVSVRHASPAEHASPTPPSAVPNAEPASLPSWTLLVDDDSYVNVPHLLRYASRFNASRPYLFGHVLDGIWPAARTLSGGAGMLLSRAALAAFGAALAARRMPLPPRGTPNDEHIVRWARRLGVLCVHSNLFSYSSLPADARVVSVVA